MSVVPPVSSLAEAAEIHWNRLGAAQRCSSRRGLAGRSWTFRPACSGSVAHVLQRFGRPCGYSFRRLLSCENMPDKQA
eukprot:15440852-Alexandrium_andersonii.AAC.1